MADRLPQPYVYNEDDRQPDFVPEIGPQYVLRWIAGGKEHTARCDHRLCVGVAGRDRLTGPTGGSLSRLSKDRFVVVTVPTAAPTPEADEEGRSAPGGVPHNALTAVAVHVLPGEQVYLLGNEQASRTAVFRVMPDTGEITVENTLKSKNVPLSAYAAAVMTMSAVGEINSGDVFGPFTVRLAEGSRVEMEASDG